MKTIRISPTRPGAARKVARRDRPFNNGLKALTSVEQELKQARDYAEAIVETIPPLIVILLTASGQDADIASAYRLGSNAFLTKPSEASKLVDTAKAIKDFWLTHNTLPQESHGPAAAPFLTQMRKTPVNGRRVPRAVTLTSRQKEVVQLIAEGYATGEIAGLLSVSIKTVDKYRQQLMETLNGSRSRSITDSVAQKRTENTPTKELAEQDSQV